MSEKGNNSQIQITYQIQNTNYSPHHLHVVFARVSECVSACGYKSRNACSFVSDQKHDTIEKWDDGTLKENSKQRKIHSPIWCGITPQRMFFSCIAICGINLPFNIIRNAHNSEINTIVQKQHK